MLDEPPVQLCCMTRHYGLMCPDGKVMCCICFNRFSTDELAEDEDGYKTDVCKPCDIKDKEALTRMENNEY